MNNKILGLAICAIILSGCNSGSSNSADTNLDGNLSTAVDNLDGQNDDSSSEREQTSSPTPDLPTTTSQVFRYSGQVQCEASGTSIESMATELVSNGIDVICSTVSNDGLGYSTICGGATGEMNVFEIPSVSVADVADLGYQPVAGLADYQETQCTSENDEAITDTVWKLVSVNEGLVSVEVEGYYSLAINGYGSVKGHIDCNTFQTAIRLGEQEFSFDSLSTTEIHCDGLTPEEEIVRVAKIMESISQYSISNGVLKLSNSLDEILVYIKDEEFTELIGLKNSIYEDIKESVADKTCDLDSQCHVVGYGHKPCGGQGSVLIYSELSIDPISITDMAQEFTNLSAQVVAAFPSELSDCSVVDVPATACIDSVCASISQTLIISE